MKLRYWKSTQHKLMQILEIRKQKQTKTITNKTT